MSFAFFRIRGRLFTAALVGAIATLIAPCPAAAQEAFPNKPITIVVGFAPGGGTDIIIRHFARAMEANLGQRIVIDNRAGAGSTIAAAFVARAPADGYTLLAGSVSTNAVAPNLYKNLPYDSQKAFAPVSLLVTAPAALVVSPKLNISSMKDLIAMYKREPGKHNFATGGGGTHAHLISEWLMITIGATAVHVPFKGAAPTVQALMAGDIDVAIADFFSFLPPIRAGKIKAIGVTGTQRDPSLPDVPTMAEHGFTNVDMGNWWALYAPAKTPQAVIDRLNREVARSVALPDYVEKVRGMAIAPMSSTPAELAARQARDTAKLGPLIRAAGIKVQ